MRLITEVTQNLNYLTEEKKGGGKDIFIEGVFAQANKPNKNGRIYPMSVMEKEIERYQKIINEKRSLGELGHPPNPQVNLDKVSHLITSLRFEGTDVIEIGRAHV